MKHVKLYEQYNTNNYIDVANELISNEKAMQWMYNVINSLPYKIKNILKKFINNKVIDLN